jgi:hypothetical protein
VLPEHRVSPESSGPMPRTMAIDFAVDNTGADWRKCGARGACRTSARCGLQCARLAISPNHATLLSQRRRMTGASDEEARAEQLLRAALVARPPAGGTPRAPTRLPGASGRASPAPISESPAYAAGRRPTAAIARQRVDHKAKLRSKAVLWKSAVFSAPRRNSHCCQLRNGRTAKRRSRR